MLQNYINHIVFVVDQSGSMSGIADETVSVFDKQVAYLAKRSQEVNQETRVSVYLFNNEVQCLVYDMDVMRLPSLRGLYYPNGSTALIDGTLKAVNDLEKTPELYGDHAFLVYVLTDGEENVSRSKPQQISQVISSADDNWTFAVLVPDQQGVHEAKKFGFPKENIAVWDVTGSGIQEVGRIIAASTDSFFTNRANGIRGSKTLFKLDVASITKKDVVKMLTPIPSNRYLIITPVSTGQIRDVVENATGHLYIKGSAYYELLKTETIQDYKQVCIFEKKSGKVYSGKDARSLLGLPNNTVNVKPENHGDYEIYVQSTSVNRKVPMETRLLVLL